jgi:hypothetical protein
MNTAKLQAIALHVFWLFLLVLSVLFYQERTFADTSYFLFKVINEGFFHIQHNRLVLAISQIGAVSSLYLGLSLNKLLIIHSLFNAAFFYGITAWLFHIIKNKQAAWLFTLLMVSSHWAYFSPYLEVFYAAGFVVLFFAAFANTAHFNKSYLIYYPLLWLALMAHPSIFLIVGAHLVFLFLADGKLTAQLKSVGLFVGAAVIVKVLSFSAYEVGRLKTVSESTINWGRAFSDLAQNYGSHYLSVTLLLISIPLLFLISNKWKLAAYVLLSYLALVGIVLLNLKNGGYKWYNEVMFLPFILSIILPIISNKDNFKSSVSLMFSVGLVLLIVWNISEIFERGELLKHRYQQMQSISSEAKDLYPNQSKFLLEDDNFERSFTEAGMQLPYEFFLASSEFGPQNTVAIAMNQMMKVDSSKALLKEKDQILLWGFTIGPIAQLDTNYFKVNAIEYQSLHSAAYSGNIDEYIERTTLELIDFPKTASVDTIISPLVQISIDDLILPSNLDHTINLSYHIYDSEGNDIIWDGERTPLEVDIKFNHLQRIDIRTPQLAGNYKVVIDLVKEGQKWFEKWVEFNVLIE